VSERKKEHGSMRLRFLILIQVLGISLYITSCNKQESRDISGSGIIEADEVEVAAETSGKIKVFAVEEGSSVKVGDILAQIDRSTLELQLLQAKAGMTLAYSQLQDLLAGARPEDIEQSRQAVVQAEENLRVAEDDFNRLSALVKSGSATSKQLEDSRARYIGAQAQHKSALQAMKKLENLARPQEIKQAEARLEQTQVSVKLIQKQIDDSTVQSPIDGVITKKVRQEGDFAIPGTILCTVADLKTVHLTIYVSEVDLGKIGLNEEAKVSIDSYPERVFSGKIVYISSVAQFTPKNVQTRDERVKLVFGVKIQIDNPEGIFKQGMPANATIPVKNTQNR
jgi:HlyD family secretion protein